MTGIQVCQFAIFCVHIFLFACLWFRKASSKGRSYWIESITMIFAISVCGGIVGWFSSLPNGWIAGVLSFSMAGMLLIVMKTFTTSGRSDGSKDSLVGARVRKYSSIAILVGLPLALAIVVTSNHIELELLGLATPFLCGACGALTVTGYFYREFGIVMMLFVGGAIGFAFLLHYLDGADRAKPRHAVTAHVSQDGASRQATEGLVEEGPRLEFVD